MVLDHTGKDANSHLYKCSIESGHPTLQISDYQVIGYGNNWNKRKIADALFIKELKPQLTEQDKTLTIKY